MGLQSVVHAIYPAQCVACDSLTADDHGLCGSCWREIRFTNPAGCDLCAAPLLSDSGGALLTCDECLKVARPWSRGRAALIYDGIGRKLVLALKHGDRTELAIPAAAWMERAGKECVSAGTLLVPVPLHWSRLLRRRYNQAALLAQHLSKRIGLEVCPDALRRVRRTSSLDGHSRDQRFAALQDAIQAHPQRLAVVKNRNVCLVDDVMTSGATLSSATEALKRAGAADVCVLVLARVAKDT